MYMDMKSQIMNTRSHSEGDVNYLTSKANSKLQEMNNSLSNIRSIEANIRVLEPRFRSPVTLINYLRIGR